MTLSSTPRIAAMCRKLTGRPDSLFASDLAERASDLSEALEGRRVLIVGGAGTIGASTMKELLRFRPAALGLMDPSENGLAEAVRMIRAGDVTFGGELAVQPLPYGSALAERWLGRMSPFDLVLSFAALKHVRSERDDLSILRMLDVNLLQADRFLRALRTHGHGREGVFFVSTDKAANPVSVMGATKRLMEHLLWTHADESEGRLPRVTSARFANVAYSDGSLPWAFLQRLEKREALGAPKGVRRYFVSPEEAGQLCLLAGALLPHRHMAIPVLDPSADAYDFLDVARVTLEHHGFEPRFCDNAAEGRASVPAGEGGDYPVVVSAADTAGEKPMEEFVASGETALHLGFGGLRAVQPLTQATSERDALAAFLADVALMVEGKREPPGKGELTRRLKQLVPHFDHVSSDKTLDDRL